jgi:mannose-6-phosphate isomerase
MMDWYPLTFEPILKPKSWGGRRLEAVLGKALPPGEQIGESWEVSDYPGDVSVVADGPLRGKSLHDLVEGDAAALLGRPLTALDGGRFPLLTKFIDATDVLSLQVHPSDALAQQLGDGHRGKTECWYVVAVEPGSTMYLGLKSGVTREAFAEALRSEDRGAITALLNAVEVRPGDFIFASAGTVHAIGAGMLFAEVSQTSDSTLRLYDWGRLPRRPTHIEAGLRALVLPGGGFDEAGTREPTPVGPHRDRLLTCRAFTVDRLRLSAGEGLHLPAGGPCEVWMTVAGRGELAYASGTAAVGAARTLLLPAGGETMDLAADEDLTVLAVQPPG